MSLTLARIIGGNVLALAAVLVACTLGAIPCAFAASSAAAPYPTKPVRLIVPYPPGGGTDFMGRAIAERLSQQLGHQVIVDNRAGASTAIGAELAARAPADGYTLLVGTITTLAVNPNLRANLPYDPIRSFDPITSLAAEPYYAAVNSAVPVRSVQELIAYARAKPEELNFGSPGVGSSGHLTAELFNNMAKTKMVHVGYKGAGPAVVGLASNQTSLMFATLATVQSLVQSGKLVLLAVTTAKRSRAMPDLPTVAESGLPGFARRSWNGLLGPSNLPQSVVQQLNTQVQIAFHDARFTERLVRAGFEPDLSTPKEFAQFIEEEIAVNARIIEVAGLKVE